MNHLTKFLEIYISQKLEIDDNKLIQSFIFGKGKDSHFIKDPRYLIYDKFEYKLRNYLIINDSISFIRRVNEKDKVIFEYLIEKKYTIKNIRPFFIIAEFVPPNASCKYCIYKNEGEDIFIKCNLKNKIVQNGIKNCKFFKQKR